MSRESSIAAGFHVTANEYVAQWARSKESFRSPVGTTPPWLPKHRALPSASEALSASPNAFIACSSAFYVCDAGDRAAWRRGRSAVRRDEGRRAGRPRFTEAAAVGRTMRLEGARDGTERWTAAVGAAAGVARGRVAASTGACSLYACSTEPKDLDGGGGGSRTRVRRYVPEGLYMRVRF
jgi:hypothetical protein